jgi:hypothetical protein
MIRGSLVSGFPVLTATVPDVADAGKNLDQTGGDGDLEAS